MTETSSTKYNRVFNVQEDNCTCPVVHCPMEISLPTINAATMRRFHTPLLRLKAPAFVTIFSLFA
jgi:hypothetical protein